MSPSCLYSTKPTTNHTSAWVEKGGITGRGVLLDYYGYAQSKQISYDLIGDKADYAITVKDLQEVAKFQGTEIKTGDILFVRSGFWVGYNALDDNGKKNFGVQAPTVWVGVETSRKTARWLWDSGIVACAGDAPGWERIPQITAFEQGLEGHTLHEVMLSGWGMPIGMLKCPFSPFQALRAHKSLQS